MKRFISTCALAAALAVGVHAQDSKTTTRTQVKADDAKADHGDRMSRVRLRAGLVRAARRDHRTR